jgi:hypothetical protein
MVRRVTTTPQLPEPDPGGRAVVADPELFAAVGGGVGLLVTAYTADPRLFWAVLSLAVFMAGVMLSVPRDGR